MTANPKWAFQVQPAANLEWCHSDAGAPGIVFYTHASLGMHISHQ